VNPGEVVVASSASSKLAAYVPEIRLLGVGWGDPPGVVAEGGEIALLDDSRGGDLEVDVAEQRGVVLVLLGVIRRGQRCGEPDDVRQIEAGDQGAQDNRPVIEQVMALVEDDRAHARGDDPVDKRTGVGMEVRVDGRPIGGQELSPDALDALGELDPVGVGVGLRHALDALARLGGIRCGDQPGRRLLHPGADGQIA
jgi:hypothetical protein